MKLEIARQIFPKYYQMKNFMKIRLVGAELLLAEGRRIMTKLIAALCNFGERV
jgi:hypothetical protein